MIAVAVAVAIRSSLLARTLCTTYVVTPTTYMPSTRSPSARHDRDVSSIVIPEGMYGTSILQSPLPSRIILKRG